MKRVAMLSLRLLPDIESRLEFLARQTGRTKCYCVRKAIVEKIDDLDDAYLDGQAHDCIRKGEETVLDPEEMWRDPGRLNAPEASKKGSQTGSTGPAPHADFLGLSLVKMENPRQFGVPPSGTRNRKLWQYRVSNCRIIPKSVTGTAYRDRPGRPPPRGIQNLPGMIWHGRAADGKTPMTWVGPLGITLKSPFHDISNACFGAPGTGSGFTGCGWRSRLPTRNSLHKIQQGPEEAALISRWLMARLELDSTSQKSRRYLPTRACLSRRINQPHAY